MNKLIFLKNSDSYSASFQISIEVSDSNSNFIQRKFSNRSIEYDDFNLTIDSEQYLEGVIDFQLANNTYSFTSRFWDYNSEKDFFSLDKIIYKRKDLSHFLMPLILTERKVNCADNLYNVLANYGGYVPFKSSNFELLVPSTTVSYENIYVKIISKKDTVYKGILEKSDVMNLGFAECDNKIVIKYDSLVVATRNFDLTGVTPKLKEGQFEIIVSGSDNFQTFQSYKLIVRWLNKPAALLDSEMAIRYLRFIIDEDSVKQILKNSDSYENALYNFWKTRDPSPSTEFNELMEEYYYRIDYCLQNFSTISGTKGTETDRAKVYVINGKPDSIERGTNNNGKITESWKYIKLKKQFTFVDEKGMGEFILKAAN